LIFPVSIGLVKSVAAFHQAFFTAAKLLTAPSTSPAFVKLAQNPHQDEQTLRSPDSSKTV